MKLIFTAKTTLGQAKWGIIGTIYAWTTHLYQFDNNFLHTLFHKSLPTILLQFGHLPPPIWPCLPRHIFTWISHGAVPSYFFWLFPLNLQQRSMFFKERGRSFKALQLRNFACNIWWKILLHLPCSISGELTTTIFFRS